LLASRATFTDRRDVVAAAQIYIDSLLNEGKYEAAVSEANRLETVLPDDPHSALSLYLVHSLQGDSRSGAYLDEAIKRLKQGRVTSTVFRWRKLSNRQASSTKSFIYSKTESRWCVTPQRCDCLSPLRQTQTDGARWTKYLGPFLRRSLKSHSTYVRAPRWHFGWVISPMLRDTYAHICGLDRAVSKYNYSYYTYWRDRKKPVT
jgi:hypothetical protein